MYKLFSILGRKKVVGIPFNQVHLRRLIKFLIIAAIVVFVAIYFSVFSPILLAILTAIICEPFVRFIRKKLKVKNRWLPVTIVFTSVILICAASLYFALTRVTKTLYEWAINIPRYAIEVQAFIDDLILRINQVVREVPQGSLIILEIERQAEGMYNKVLQFTAQFLSMLGAWLQSIPNTIFVSLVYFIVFFLVSLDFPKIVQLFYNLFKSETSDKLRHVFNRMGKVFLGYWKAQFIMSIGVFAITYVSLLFISPRSALAGSLVIWLVDIIPLYVGPALILVPWGIIAMILGNMNMGIQLIVLATVLLILRRIIEPKVLGDFIGLAALPTVLSMYFGFVFFGVMGLILGPFVYIAIRSAQESGLFDLEILKSDPENEALKK